MLGLLFLTNDSFVENATEVNFENYRKLLTVNLVFKNVQHGVLKNLLGVYVTRIGYLFQHSYGFQQASKINSLTTIFRNEKFYHLMHSTKQVVDLLQVCATAGTGH